MFSHGGVEMLFNLINLAKLVLIYIHHSGSRGDHEKCDISNTPSEAGSKETVGLYRGGSAKLSKSFWLSRKSSQEIIPVFWFELFIERIKRPSSSELSCFQMWLKKKRSASSRSSFAKTLSSNLLLSYSWILCKTVTMTSMTWVASSYDMTVDVCC